MNFPWWKPCSRHLVTISLNVVLRTPTNNYFLLFSPFTMYRWKNPQYKFLLLLDRQWPMYAQCRRCLFPLFMFEFERKIFFFSNQIYVKRLNWRKGNNPPDEVTSCAAIFKLEFQWLTPKISLFSGIFLTCFLFLSVGLNKLSDQPDAPAQRNLSFGLNIKFILF